MVIVRIWGQALLQGRILCPPKSPNVRDILHVRLNVLLDERNRSLPAPHTDKSVKPWKSSSLLNDGRFSKTPFKRQKRQSNFIPMAVLCRPLLTSENAVRNTSTKLGHALRYADLGGFTFGAVMIVYDCMAAKRMSQILFDFWKQILSQWSSDPLERCRWI